MSAELRPGDDLCDAYLQACEAIMRRIHHEEAEALAHAAARLADQSARILPLLASSPVRDPRSPQNLVPVGALERALTHRLGDRRWVSRLITVTVGREQAEALA